MKNLILTLLIGAPLIGLANGDSAQHYFKQGLVEKSNKRFLVAHQAFQKSITFDALFKDAYVEDAAVLMEMRRIYDAKLCYEKLLEIDPQHAIATRELAQLYFDYRQFDKAIELAQKCSACSSRNRIIGMSYYHKEDYASAEKYLLDALKENPADAEATYCMARNYLDMESYKQAVPWYEKAIALPNAKSSWMYELGLLYYNNNNFVSAVAAFEKAAAAGYTVNNDFNENLGFAAIYAGQMEKGEALLLEILKRKPNNVTLLRDMAETFYTRKQYDKSLQYCQKLMEINPKDGKALYQAGLCFIKKGEKDRGQQMCDKAIELEPSLANLLRKKEMPAGL